MASVGPPSFNYSILTRWCLVTFSFIALGACSPSLVSISGGGFHTCGLRSGLAYCWGENDEGQLGNDVVAEDSLPRAVDQISAVPVPLFHKISAGWSHTCALFPFHTGLAYCWGSNDHGQLGIDSRGEDQSIPMAVDQDGLEFVDIAAGGFHTCGRISSGAVYCWGNNQFGQLGNDDDSEKDVMTPAIPVGNGQMFFDEIAAGGTHTCGRISGQVYCWGHNNFGQLGNNTKADSTVAVAVVQPSGVDFAEIALGDNFSCGRTTLGDAYCWGYGAHRQLGNNDNRDSSVPVVVHRPANVTFAEITAGLSHACARTTTGEAYCWGANGNGQLGDGTFTDSAVPVAVVQPSGTDFEEITAGAYHTCALTSKGEYCWGQDQRGQVGDGGANEEGINRPTRVTRTW